MLFTIHRFQVAGVVEAEREGIVKRVHIKEGNVVHATSTDLNDSLGTYLLRAGKLDPEQYAATMREREKGERRYGAILIESGLLSPAEVYEAIREQVEGIVWSLFYWQDGRVTFSIGDPGGGGRVAVQLPMRQVVLQGIKRAPNARALVARLGRRDTVFVPDFETEQLIGLALDADEHRLLRMVDGERSLYQICDEGPLTAADNAKLLYAFQVLRLIKKAPVQQDGAQPDEVAPNEAQSSEAPPNEAGGGAAEEPVAANGGTKGAERAERESGAVKIRFKTPGDRFS